MLLKVLFFICIVVTCLGRPKPFKQCSRADVIPADSLALDNFPTGKPEIIPIELNVTKSIRCDNSQYHSEWVDWFFIERKNGTYETKKNCPVIKYLTGNQFQRFKHQKNYLDFLFINELPVNYTEGHFFCYVLVDDFGYFLVPKKFFKLVLNGTIEEKSSTEVENYSTKKLKANSTDEIQVQVAIVLQNGTVYDGPNDTRKQLMYLESAGKNDATFVNLNLDLIIFGCYVIIVF